MILQRRTLIQGLALSTGLTFITPSAAEDETASYQNTVVVTATRTAQTVNASTASVVVIDRAEIERRQARSVPDLLRGIAGVQVASNGGRGKSASMFVRGTESDHVVVLIDGVKVGAATSGQAPFQDLAIEQVERIEIVRGPRSSLYGSEAIGGVIQIFTRKGEGSEGVTGGGSMTIGSNATRELSAYASAQDDALSTSFGGTATRTKGYDSCGPEAGAGAACFIDEPDDDGYESESAYLNLAYEEADGTRIALSGRLSRNENEFDGGFVNQGDSEQSILSAQFDLPVSDVWVVRSQIARSKDYSNNALDDTQRTTFDTERDMVSLFNEIYLNDAVLFTLGGDYQRDEISTASEFAETERENIGTFGQMLVSADELDIEASLRYDDNEFSGHNTTQGIGLSYQVNQNMQWRASYGTAFKAPSFNELYFPFFGNPDLKPEESKTTDFGIRLFAENTTVDIAVFNTEVDELIVYDPTIFAPNNIDQAEIMGLELSVQQQIDANWRLGVNLTAQSPRNVSDDANDGNLLPRRPKRSGRVDIDYAAADWNWGGSVLFASSAYDNIGNTTELDAYQVLDLRAGMQLAEHWQVQGRLENVFDSYYESAYLYAQPGRGVYFTLRYTP